MQEAVDAAYLRERAAKCDRLASCLSDPEAVAALRNMALKYRSEANLRDALTQNDLAQPKPKLPPQT